MFIKIKYFVSWTAIKNGIRIFGNCESTINAKIDSMYKIELIENEVNKLVNCDSGSKIIILNFIKLK